MAKKFYISDCHFGHANSLMFDNRPFKDANEMDEAMIQNWNNVVDKGDFIYVLGDMFWKGSDHAIPILEQLNGQTFLIKGNHDRVNNKEFASHFVKIADYLEVEDEGRRIVLSHYPIPCFKNHFYGWYHLYGHVHSSFEWNMMERCRYETENLYTRPCEMYNVGAMMPYMNYTPRTLDEIIAGYKKEKEKTDGENNV